MRTISDCATLASMDTEHDHDRDRDFDQDTVGDHDENTLDGSEGLDADTLTTDGEDLTVEPPETWIPAEEHHNLDDKLAAERPDSDDSSGERRDSIDELDPEGTTRILGED